MWKLLQRTTTISIPPPPPPDRAPGLSALTRLWRPTRRTRPPVKPVGSEPHSTARRAPAELRPAQSPAISDVDTAPLGERLSPPAPDYATRLLLLKSQHAALSAERTQLDHDGERQRERVADLEARLHFILCTLQSQTAAESTTEPPPLALESHQAPTLPGKSTSPESSQTPTARFVLDPLPLSPSSSAGSRPSPVLVSVPVPVEAYRSAVAAAQRWQELALELERQLYTVSQLVRIDSLTGLHNRRSFDEHLPRSVARAQREGESLCLLMIDIDHFKRLNDTFGHPAGDAVLRSVASSIAGCTRPSDQVARYGGEEFAVVLSDVDSVQAAAVAERIRRQVAMADHCPHKVTVSIGVAEYSPTEGGGHAELLSAADRALYTAKHSGRNRIQIAPGGTSTGEHIATR